MLEENDWRLTCQEEYLMNAKLIRKQYQCPSPEWDHDHCAFCWDKFSEYGGDLHEGYRTAEGNWWICDECYEDFKKMFHFQLVSPE